MSFLAPIARVISCWRDKVVVMVYLTLRTSKICDDERWLRIYHVSTWWRKQLAPKNDKSLSRNHSYSLSNLNLATLLMRQTWRLNQFGSANLIRCDPSIKFDRASPDLERSRISGFEFQILRMFLSWNILWG